MTRATVLKTVMAAILACGAVGCSAPAGGDNRMKAARPDDAPADDGERFEQARRALDEVGAVEAMRVTAVLRSVTDGFHGYPVEQRVAVTDMRQKRRLLAALREADVKDRDFVMACVFQPHHALRVTADGGTTDYLLCFRCAQGMAFLPDGRPAPFTTDASARAAFDAVLGPEPTARPRLDSGGGIP